LRGEWQQKHGNEQFTALRFFGVRARDSIVSFADLHYMTAIEFRPDDVASDRHLPDQR
jgi:hypothetical protein